MIPARQQVVLGTATLGLNEGRDGAYRLLDAYVDQGGEIVDTAAVYNDWVSGEIGRSETIIGEWLKRRPGRRPFICTKGAHPPLGDMSRSRLDRASITADVEASLRRLQLDRIDLYFLHRDDDRRPVEDILDSLASLVDAGKIENIGLSNWSPWRVAAARAAGILPVSSNQVLGNVLCRQMGPATDPTTRRLGGGAYRDAELNQTSLLLYSSQCSGYFTKRLGGMTPVPVEYRTDACATTGAAIAALATAHRTAPGVLAVAFLLAFSPLFFPVVGPRTAAQLGPAMEAASQALEPSLVNDIATIADFSSMVR